MKIKKFLILLSALFLVGCGVNTTDNSENGNNNQQDNQNDNDDHNDNNDNNDDDNQEENYTTKRMQDTPILHCWNWSMNNVLNNLESIKEAGFKTIQLSPMQVQKDYYSTDSISNGWWKLYQPLSFTIAKNNNENILGTKNELINVCKKAKELEIDVIVDVVSNHLAGGSKNSLHNNVSRYESDIYNNNLIHNLNKYADDNNLQSIVQGNIGDFPDLKTESTIVQNRVLSLLKEYIDCGVNGFRFDAAKHIETPDDGSYASNYWPTILNGATSYAKSKSLDEPYYFSQKIKPHFLERNQ